MRTGPGLSSACAGATKAASTSIVAANSRLIERYRCRIPLSFSRLASPRSLCVAIRRPKFQETIDSDQSGLARGQRLWARSTQAYPRCVPLIRQCAARRPWTSSAAISTPAQEAAMKSNWLKFFPPAQWLAEYRTDWLRPDIIAGVTLAAYAIPVSLAYAALAGLPPQIGIYGYMLGGIGYALLGTSRQLAAGHPLRYGQIASLTALAVASLCLVAWLFRLSMLVRLVSDSILVGFKAGAGLTIIMTQLPGLFGVAGGGHNFFDRLIRLLGQLGDIHWIVLAIGLVAIALLLLGERFLPGKPVGLTVVALSILIATLLNLPARGIPVTGNIPSGLPSFAIPTFGLLE